jgi:hypothetical protein
MFAKLASSLGITAQAVMPDFLNFGSSGWWLLALANQTTPGVSGRLRDAGCFFGLAPR